MTRTEREAWDLLRRIDAVEARLVDQSRRFPVAVLQILDQAQELAELRVQAMRKLADAQAMEARAVVVH